MNAEVKVAKINAELVQLQTAKELFIAVLDNPIIDLLGGVMLVEYWRANQGGDWSHQLVDSVLAGTMETALIAVCTAKAISPALNSPAGQALVGKFIK